MIAWIIVAACLLCDYRNSTNSHVKLPGVHSLQTD